ncbi:nonsense-mediated mRNA decay factor SMG7 [Plutella xylostella]|uniref:nonsense-mediated mRNA decay factor SMG7 n=1 Tax=Plutella xylostella TaxID=51655 RepID=UPI002032559B|nr:nonsense-mediated mRNA decay factor SMG7 [Plutella xylostella]
MKMVLNAAVQMLREADELKEKILKFKSGTSMLQDRNLWVTQQQLQKVYQKVLVLDLDYALDKKVEQDLWNVGFKQQIEALQAIAKDRKNPSRSEGQAMLSWVLQAAAGFYLCLLHQICTTFKLDLPFRRRASLVGAVEGWSVSPTTAAPAAARYIAQHCLVHLGDLHRYRHQLRAAHTFYRHALIVSAHSGQPYNQLALLAWRRGRRLPALYWHVRSLLVRAPFPPAPNNLATTLHAACHGGRDSKDLPVLPGITDAARKGPAVAAARPLDPRAYVDTLLRTMHLIHSLEELDTVGELVDTLNSSLTALVATGGFESMTLIKMIVVLIWLVHSSTEGLTIPVASLSEREATAARHGAALAGGAALALLLPTYTLPAPPRAAAPALKVWLQWVTCNPALLTTPAFLSRPQLWPALAHTANKLQEEIGDFSGEPYATLPLPEDRELHGFVPIEAALAGLQLSQHSAWETFGDRIPAVKIEEADADDDSSPSERAQMQLLNDPELQHRVRCCRLLQLTRALADLTPDTLSYSTENNITTFTAASLGGHQLSAALGSLTLAAALAGDAAGEGEGEGLSDSDDDAPPPPAPVIISEHSFREKVREKRVGILKPQGSLERAREERALASTQDDDEVSAEAEDSKSDDSKRAERRPRMNVAMAAIMRKQEEVNKQVKFVTPPPTPDSITESADASTSAKDAKSKVVHPKAIKSLANLPIGRKTGGILSLKDKSAGYPHLVNTDPEPPVKKPEKDEKKEIKLSQSSQNTHQNYPLPKKQELSPGNWSGNPTGPPAYGDAPRFNLQHKNAYGLQTTGINYSPNYQQSVNNQGIRLPVVNPKEIDVRTAALQKQNLRQEPYQEHKFNQNYQMSGDKKNFLSDLPPRFANQYRYWQSAQDNTQENKFREDNFLGNTLFSNNQPQNRPNWMMNQQEPFQQPPPWWQPDNPPPNFAPNYTSPSINQPTNFYNPPMANPFQNMPSYQNQNFAQNKPDNATNYMHSAVGQPQMQVQNVLPSPNFSALNNFGSYAPTVSYDSSMYPQFNKLGYQGAKAPQYQQKEMDMGLVFGAGMGEMAQRNQLNFKEGDASKNRDHSEQAAGGADAGSTYSLFSGAPRDPSWGAAQPQQSLWSGPGPSPLERLLEQQKQLKQPPTEPH